MITSIINSLNIFIKYIGILLLIVILYKIDHALFIKQIAYTNLWLLLIVLLLNFPHLLIKTFRWNLLLKQQNIEYSLIQAFSIYLSSLYIGFITPGRMGEFAKVLYLKSDKKIKISKGFSSVLVDRLFDFYLLCFLAFYGAWYFNVFGEFSSFFLILLVLLLVAPIIFLNKRIINKIIQIIFKFIVVKHIKDKFENHFNDFHIGLMELFNFRLIISGLLTCLGYLLFFVQCNLIILALGISIDFMTITLFMAIANLVSFIPISISGLGTRDATLLFLFGLIDIQPEIAISFSFLIFFLFFFGGGFLGFIAFFRNPLKF